VLVTKVEIQIYAKQNTKVYKNDYHLIHTEIKLPDNLH